VMADADNGVGRGGIVPVRRRPTDRRGSEGGILGTPFSEGGRPKGCFPGVVSDGLSSAGFEEISTLLTASSIILTASLS
jgi:hypothetical protein